MVTRDQCPCWPLCYWMQPLSPLWRWREWADGKFQFLPFNLPLSLQPVFQTSGGGRWLPFGLKKEGDSQPPRHPTTQHPGPLPSQLYTSTQEPCPCFSKPPSLLEKTGALSVIPRVDSQGWVPHIRLCTEPGFIGLLLLLCPEMVKIQGPSGMSISTCLF